MSPTYLKVDDPAQDGLHLGRVPRPLHSRPEASWPTAIRRPTSPAPGSSTKSSATTPWRRCVRPVAVEVVAAAAALAPVAVEVAASVAEAEDLVAVAAEAVPGAAVEPDAAGAEQAKGAVPPWPNASRPSRKPSPP